MVSFRPLRIGWWEPFQMAFPWFMNPSYSLRFTSVVTHPPSRVAGCFGWGQKWSKNPHWGKISHFCFFPYPWRTYGTGICTLYILIHLPQKINHSPCGFSWMSWSKSIMVLIMFSNHIQVVEGEIPVKIAWPLVTWSVWLIWCKLLDTIQKLKNRCYCCTAPTCIALVCMNDYVFVW